MSLDEILARDSSPGYLIAQLVNLARDNQEIQDRADTWWRRLQRLVPDINMDTILSLVAENADRLNAPTEADR